MTLGEQSDKSIAVHSYK